MAITNAEMAEAWGELLGLTPEKITQLAGLLDQWAQGGARLATLARLITDLNLFNNAATAMIFDWYGGNATGGPNGDGLYPLMNSEGEVELVPSPAKIMAGVSGLDPKGVLASEDDLPATGEAGDLWVIDGDAWGWSASDNRFNNLGPFQGASALMVMVGRVAALEASPGGTVESVGGLTGAISAWDLNGALGVRADFGQQAISLARLTGQIQGMARGVADDFQTTDGVDAAASTGEQYNAGTKTYSGVPGSALPLMTEASAPAGNEATASSVGNPGALPPWKAFDGLDNTIWLASSGALPQWLRRKIAAPAMVTTYSIQAGDTASGGNGPTAWTVRGSNNGTDWTVIDTRTGIAWVVNKQVQTFTVQSPGSYLYYELNITAASGGAALQVIEWTMTTAPQNMSLRSAPVTAAASPSKATLMVRAKGSSALTPGVDIRGFASRDAGTTWTEATLTAGITTGGFTTFDAANVDLSAQPGGPGMKWRVDTTATKAPEVDAVVLQWSAN